MQIRQAPPVIFSLQYLRAAAAIMVALFHAAQQLERYQELPAFYRAGAAGVDIFFIISGFIIWATTVNADQRPGDFAMRRITRIVPLYWAVTIAMFLMPAISGTIANGVVSDPYHLFASLLFIPHAPPHDPTQFFPIYVPGWTIIFEMYFYAIFSLCLLIRAAPMRLAVLMLALAGLAALGQVLETGPVAWYTSLIIIEFAFGVLIAALYTARVRVPSWVAAASLAAGVAGLAAMSDILPDMHQRALVWGVPAAFLVFGAVFLEANGWVPRYPRLCFAGDASYALYLTHLFAIGAVAVVWYMFDLWTNSAAVLFLAACLGMSLILAAAVHWFVEIPMLRASRRLSAMLASGVPSRSAQTLAFPLRTRRGERRD
jgi:exopolysaccharide production protein ExoZ